MANLQDFKDDLAREAHGMTTAEAHAKGVCIECKQPPRFKTEAGHGEYRISGMCEYCWDTLFAESEEDEEEGISPSYCPHCGELAEQIESFEDRDDSVGYRATEYRCEHCRK